MVTARRIGTNENIQTFGVGRDFTAVSTWEALTDNDLVAGSLSETLECFADLSVFVGGVNLSGAITDANFFRSIRPATGQGHDGTSNSGVAFDTTANTNTFTLAEDNFHLHDLVLSVSQTTASTRSAIAATGDNSHIVGCIAYDCINTGTGGARGIVIGSTSDNSFTIDCLAENCDTAGIRIAGSTNVAYNNTVVNNSALGFDIASSSTILKNCLSAQNATDFSGAVDATSTNNASSDSSAPGLNPQPLRAFTFVDEPGNDYHLSVADVGAANLGADLSADAVFAFTDDIDGQTFLIWDIGFDENTEFPSIGVEEEAVSCTTGTRVFRWDSVTENSVNGVVTVNGCLPLSVMVEGDFGVGGVAGLEGSNSSSGNFYALNTLSTFSVPGISPVVESALRIRPAITAGTGVLLDFYLIVKGVI